MQSNYFEFPSGLHSDPQKKHKKYFWFKNFSLKKLTLVIFLKDNLLEKSLLGYCQTFLLTPNQPDTVIISRPKGIHSIRFSKRWWSVIEWFQFFYTHPRSSLPRASSPHGEFSRLQKDVLGFPGSARPEAGLLELLLHSSDQIPKANASPTLPWRPVSPHSTLLTSASSPEDLGFQAQSLSTSYCASGLPGFSPHAARGPRTALPIQEMW